ncbi:uncharacterized protein RAG0_17661 [Rhynchosporium agropyri]|uniref:HAT C-terminal dimerisation domain-containing protein n=1 Tax=Rhynchosporium agropyri TaxID=914238 RepID=A0A1E1LU35_9HELO|nr:uncharacterized protein RAG0_17661 [Rhynchosporium agropyri]
MYSGARTVLGAKNHADAYLEVIIHFINSDLDLKSYLLSMVLLESIHSSRYMNKVLIKTLKDYDIEYNITSITRDNASSNNLLIDAIKEEEEEELEEEDLPRNINYSIWKVPEVYIIYNRLNKFKEGSKDPLIIYAINKRLAKVRKYYPKEGFIGDITRNRALYIALVLDPRIKREGLSNIGLSSGLESDIYTQLHEKGASRYVIAFTYYKVNKERFKVLSLLARKYL